MTDTNHPPPQPTTIPSPEKTFRAYTKEQGAAYAQNRPGYHPNLFTRILNHHVSTTGQLNNLLDIGCGPGTATIALAPSFQNALGLDTSAGMIQTARSLNGTSASGQPIRYEISTAENIGTGPTGGLIERGTIDLITAATAAHWFDMRLFWKRAAWALRPGGTVALWTADHHGVHESVPNAGEINRELDLISSPELDEYREPGNLLVRGLYADLVMPWDLAGGGQDQDESEGESENRNGSVGQEFDQGSMVRKVWGVSGEDDVEAEGAEFFVGGQMLVGMDYMEAVLATASPITRWREAHRDLVGTEGDVVRRMRRVIERWLREAGVEEGQEMVRGNVSGVLIMVKRK